MDNENMTVGELIEKLSSFPKSSRVQVNYGHAGDIIPENSPVHDVSMSKATGVVYLKVNYDVVCTKCGHILWH